MPLFTEIVLGNRYRIVELPCQSSFDVIYRALKTKLNRSVIVYKDVETSPTNQRQFGLIAPLLVKLRHLNLTWVEAHFILLGGQYLVKEGNLISVHRGNHSPDGCYLVSV